MTRHSVLALALVCACGGKEKEKEKPPADAAPASMSDAAPVVDAVAIDATPPTPSRVEHAVFDLVDNRHGAHRIVAGDLVVDASGVAFARYTRFGVPVRRWRYGQTLDGQRVAIPDKLALVEVPLTVEQARTSTQLSMRVYATTDMTAELKVNGRKASKDPRVDLTPGWQTVAVAIEPGRFFVGENQLVLESRKRTVKTEKGKPADKSAATVTDKKAKKAEAQLGVQWIRLGDPRPLDDHDPRQAAVFDTTAHAIALDKDATLTWFVSLPDGAHLVADVSPGCSIEVRARPSADAFAGGALSGPASRVDLTAMGGKVVALSLTTRECARATVTAPRITLQGPAPELLAKAPPPKYIVLWVMDALRADRVPTFTPGARALTPNFDELAKTSAVFRQYYVQGNESQTSHSSVWTGVYPAVHNVRMAGVGGVWSIDKRFDVIANLLSTDGNMATTAVTGNGFVNDSGGYARGFKEFRNMMREKGSGVINGVIYGATIVDAALGQLDKARTDPTYLFLGTIDTHGPWIARKPWIDTYSPGPYNGPFKEFGTAKDLGFKPGSMGCSIIPPPEDIERLRAIYDSAISYQDAQLGRFVEQLRTWGIWDETMLLVTADHGEEFFEDRRCGHGGSLRDTLIRVPLLVHDPSRFPGGTIVDEGAEGVDIFPTIADSMGLPIPEQVQGHSLAPLAQGRGRNWPSPSYTSMYEYAHAMRIGRWKIRVPKTGVPIISDMVDDPGEMKEVSAEKPVERRMLTDNIGLFLALRTQWKKTAWGVVTNVTPDGAKALDEATVP